MPGALRLLLEVGKSLPADWQRPRTLRLTLATGSARSNRQQAPKTSPWPASGHDRDELDYGLGKAVFGAVTTGGVRRAR